MILRAATEAFAESGFTATSMSGIAERLGVVKAVLYASCPGGKRELHREVIRQASRRFRRIVSEDLSRVDGHLPDAIEIAVCALSSHARRDPHGSALLFGDPGTPDPRILAVMHRARGRALKYLSELCASALERNDAWDPTLELAITALAHELARRLALDPRFDAEAAAAAAAELLTLGAAHGRVAREADATAGS